MWQKTIASPASVTGIGLHSGREVRVSLRPAEADTGIVFTLVTPEGRHIFSPSADAVRSTQLATTLTHGRAEVATVEHLLAAIRGLGIDNLQVEIEGGEAPILDGSAAPFVDLLDQAGVREQKRPARVLALTRPVSLVEDGKSIRAIPHRGLVVDYTIDFPHPSIGRQRLALEITPDNFRRLAPARTFGFLREVEWMRANGLARGGSLANAVVLDEDEVLNPDGLRFADEFVRHKILDFLGDMAVMGAPVWGRFEVVAGGHGLHNAFWRTVEAQGVLEPLSLVRERIFHTPRREPRLVQRPQPLLA